MMQPVGRRAEQCDSLYTPCLVTNTATRMEYFCFQFRLICLFQWGNVPSSSPKKWILVSDHTRDNHTEVWLRQLLVSPTIFVVWGNLMSTGAKIPLMVVPLV